MFRATFTQTLTTLSLLGGLAVYLPACSGDDGATDTDIDASTTTDDTGSSSGTTAGASTSTTEGDSSTTSDGTTAGTTEDPGTTTEGTTSDGTTSDGTTTGVTDENDYGVFVFGTLYTDNLEEAQAYHDPLAAGGEDAAKMLGDFGHDALLGTTLLGTEENKFLGVDRWDNAEGMQAFYADPMFMEAFLPLFDENGPTVETYVERPDWYTWGDMTSGDEFGDYWFVIAKGTLADTPENMQEAHDMVAAAGEEAVQMAGDVAHVVFLGLEDPQQFLAVDIWNNNQAIEAVYGDPDFQMAFASLFMPDTISIEVYRSTDWHQW